jgi:glycine hydroxymethyltransferase
MKEDDMEQIAEAIAMVIKNQENGIAGARDIVQSLTDKYPLT